MHFRVHAEWLLCGGLSMNVDQVLVNILVTFQHIFSVSGHCYMNAAQLCVHVWKAGAEFILV